MLESFRIRRLSVLLVRKLGDSGKKLVLAESCTGGLVSAALTAIPGSSGLLWGGGVVYSNEAKTRLAGVPESIFRDHGAVSRECVEALLRGSLDLSGADLSAAVSGIAGPGGGSPEKPVGTVWIGAASSSGRVDIRQFRFQGGRRSIRLKSCLEALLMIRGIASGEGLL